MVTVFMPLLNEGTDVWRPVEVTPHDGASYRVDGPMPPDEAWEFTPGSLIKCRWKKFGDGEHRLIPVGSAWTVSSALGDHLRRSAGISIGSLPLIAAVGWLPRGPEGRTEIVPVLLTSTVWTLIAVITLIWLKPRALFGKSAIWSMLGFAILFCLVGLSGEL